MLPWLHHLASYLRVIGHAKFESYHCYNLRDTLDFRKGRCLLLLMRIRSAHLEKLGFPVSGAY